MANDVVDDQLPRAHINSSRLTSRVAAQSASLQWSVAPTLGWFCLFATIGLLLVDHNVEALSQRLTSRRSNAPIVMPGSVDSNAAAVAAADDADVDSSSDDPIAAAGGGSGGGSATAKPAVAAALDLGCVEGEATACKKTALAGFTANAQSARNQKLSHALRISFYGDSVIASDLIPAALRKLMWSEFGNGGPGFVYVVPPHRFCGNESIKRSSSGTWIAHAVSTTMVADRWFGAGNSSAETSDGTAKISVKDGTVSNVTLHYLAQPHGGSAALTTDRGELGSVDTANDSKTASSKTFTVAQGASSVTLTASGKLRTFGLVLENSTGAVVDNLGIVSVNAKNFAFNQPAHFAEQVAVRGADLIVVMIGANEAQWLGPGDQDTKEYQARYEALLAPIRKGAPNASCLVVAPTDQAYVVGDGYASRPVMPMLVAAQHAAAKAKGCAFFDTYTWMGGKGSAEQWLKKGLVGTDFQHLTRKGAGKLADALYRALIAVRP
jgi:lysophospholipase L1-like esterase